MWSGDLTLDTLGEVAVKLRTAAGVRGMSVGWSRGSHSEYIARVKLALVGASVTAVFERQVRKVSSKATTTDEFHLTSFAESSSIILFDTWRTWFPFCS